MPADLPHLLITGGGFGGLYAARALARAPVSVTLIDRRNYQLFRPMLYQVATGLLSADEIAGPLRSILRRRVLGLRPPPPFWYWDKGDLAIVRRTYAVADLRFLRFAGFPAWIVWALVRIYFLIGFATRFFVLLQWGLAFATKRRQVRIFPSQADHEEPGAKPRTRGAG